MDVAMYNTNLRFVMSEQKPYTIIPKLKFKRRLGSSFAEIILAHNKFLLLLKLITY